ncbi:serine/threonine protein kinase [Gaeumannomyces tritici R3-111a-1]|uniref:Serine/threonine protein kinase n=1 Tax=Gaeumannomyces tritici (strain R3-111a-1) TaxID=644352 RepID=J3P068_GAET3|nr:serine/threonine protein kinase [Gaeumannomyces tritici R3-111a-1]EJT77001.1 serine/threonine protein kinase [Gaeumannomyces tritici R3-111a-1]
MPSEKIESLRREIHNRRLTNTAGEEFVPDKWLSDLLTEERILDALEALDDSIIDKDECPQVARDIWKFGLKTFAIFLTMGKPDLVYRFFQTDQFDKDTCGLLDRRLPMEEAKLEHALGLTHIREDINNLVEDAKQKGVVLDSNPNFKRLKEQEAECIDLCQRFMSIQDVFLSPTFPQGPLHRLLLDSTRLPFVSNSEHRETADAGAAQQPQGAFGKVSMEALPQRCYGDKRGMVVVRKELKSQGKEAYRGELRCLRLLAAARHPSLLELYGSYTYHTKHNFLFHEAVQGDLHDLLEAERRLPEFQHDDAFYLAFCGLASALEQVHCYANDDLKLKMIGCHHDLKPRNVLVDGGRFILADFGLATMTDERVDPTTLAQDRDLYFAAPENIDYVNSIRRPVGPPGDIWSLGCILAEVHTFMRGGRDAVRDFRLSRAFDQDFGDMIMTIKAFHDGLGNLNPATVRHLDEMKATIRAEAEARAAHRRQHIPELGLIRLVREMLTINDLARPDIKKILQRLRCVTLQKKSEPVCDELLVSPHSKNVEFIIERQVFREWLGRLEEVGQRGQLYLPSDAAFNQACNTIDALLDELRRLSQDDLESPLFSQLRRLNEQLLSCLDVAGRLSIRRDVERNAIPIARELARESGLPATSVSETALLASGPNASILRLLAVAQVNARMRQEGDQAVPRLKSTDVTLLDPPKVADAATTFRLGTLKQDGGAVEIPVVVEEMTIEAKHAEPKDSDRLFKRLKNVLVLGATDTLPDFRALSCSGIYFDMDKELIGITYKYPTNVSSSDSSTRVASLAQLLSEQPHTVDYERNLVVGLDDRVRLARDLALAVSNFHHIGWMHKNLSSHTVLFFLDATPSSGAPTSPRPPPRRLALSAPALIGFSHSRQSDETLMSSKRYHTSTELRAYHHPKYAGEGGGGDRDPYRAEFDYYSLGLVLLELGHWWPLRKIVQDRRDRAAMRKYLLQRSVPFLAGAMGEAYASATEACLSGDLEKGSVEGRFSRLVIAPLEELLGNGVGM